MSQNFFIVKDNFEYAGDHLIIDIFNGKNLDNEIHIHSTLLQCVEAAGATLLHIDTHQFELNGGVSGVAVLAESHISIHTWPENGMAVCDVFTCGQHTNPRSGATYMYEAMGATDLVSEIFQRPLV